MKHRLLLLALTISCVLTGASGQDRSAAVNPAIDMEGFLVALAHGRRRTMPDVRLRLTEPCALHHVYA